MDTTDPFGSFGSLSELPLFGDDIESVDLGQYFNVEAPIKITPAYSCSKFGEPYPLWISTLNGGEEPVFGATSTDYACHSEHSATSSEYASESSSPQDSPFDEALDLPRLRTDALECVPSLPVFQSDENAVLIRPQKRKADEGAPSLGFVKSLTDCTVFLPLSPDGTLPYNKLNKLELEDFERCYTRYHELGYVTAAVDKELRKVRRKIKGRIYAKERRESKKQREGSLEDKNRALSRENVKLKDQVITLSNKVEILTSENTRLRGQMAQLQIYYQKNAGASDWGFTPNKKRAISTGATLCAVLFFVVFWSVPGTLLYGTGSLDGGPNLATGRVILQFEPDSAKKYYYDFVKVQVPNPTDLATPGSFVECDYRNSCYLYKPKPEHRNTYTRHVLSEIGAADRPPNYEAIQMVGIPISQLNETLATYGQCLIMKMGE